MDISEIKPMRKKLGLTQAELAKKASVSQSLIAKIESSRIDPTFSKIKKIFDVLDGLTKKESLKAKDVMNKNIISIRMNDNISKVVKLIRSHGISQLPVIDKHVIGIVSEGSILEKIREGKKIEELKVKDVVEDNASIIPQESEISLVLCLLRYTPVILVEHYGKIKGLITKSDILRRYEGG